MKIENMDEEFYKFIKELYNNMKNIEDEDKKVIRSYCWLALQCLFEIKNLINSIEKKDKKLIKELKELNKELKKLNNNFDKIITKQEKLDYWYEHLNEKINAIISELNKK